MPPPRLTLPTIGLLLLSLTHAPTLVTAKTRTLKINNGCKETLWMAYFTSVGPQPSHVTGWEAPSGTSEDLVVEESWGGRVWARTGCDFTADVPDYEMCETGGCVGGLECSAKAGTGRLPVTLAEFNLQTEIDHYDTSNVDGFNVPMALTTPGKDCPLSNCPFDLRQNCPDDLKKKNAAGDTVGCLTDCGATEKPEHCCAGAYDKPDTCPVSNIPNYKWWKENCPIAYAYAYDESSGTALFTCTLQPDYTITFCPSDDLYEDTAVLPDGSIISQGTGIPAETVAITGGSGGGAPAEETTGGAEPTATGGGGGTDTANEPGATGTGAAPAPGASGSGAGGGASGGGGAETKTTAAGTGGASPTSKPTSAAASAGGTAAPSSSTGSSSADSDADSDIFGMSQTMVISIAAVVIILLVAGIGAALYMKKGGGRGKHRRVKDDDSSDEDDDQGSGTDTGSSGGSSDDGGGRRR